MESRNEVKIKSTTYDQAVLKWNATKRDRGTNISPIATGTRNAGPRIPTVVGIRQVKKAASQPNPARLANI